MTNEERDRAIDFVIDSLAKQEVRLDQLIHSQELTEHRLNRYERIMKMMIRAGRRERRARHESEERLTKALTDLTEAQKRTEFSIAHTDRKLDALIDIVRQRLNGSV